MALLAVDAPLAVPSCALRYSVHKARPPLLGRRSFLLRSAAGTAAIALAGCGTSSGNVVDLGHPLVIGSGFGGGVSALRLTQAGVHVTMLERGRRWPITDARDTFCSLRAPDQRSAWLATESPIGLVRRGLTPYTGLIERFEGDNIDAMVGSAVGGGSLAYAGMLLRVPRSLWSSVFPSDISYDDMENTWYPRVSELLPGTQIPADILASPTYESARVFMDHAMRAGLTLEMISQAIDWDLVRAEIEGDMPQEAVAGDYIYGLNSGAKGSIDRTYLAAAEATGHFDLRPLHQVTSVAQAQGGGFRVECERIAEDGTVLERITFLAPVLVMSAGSIHTTRLLVEARGRGAIPSLPSEIGERWGQNGQHILVRGQLTENTGALQGGPPFVVIRDLDNAIAPVTMEYGAAAWGFESHKLICPSSSIPDAYGGFRYDASQDRALLEWDPASKATARGAAESVGMRLNAATGGDIEALPGRSRESTFHPLGGCVMGRATDTFGRVRGVPGLYVVDGSLIPGVTPTCNPSWTITALAERALDTIVREDFA